MTPVFEGRSGYSHISYDWSGIFHDARGELSEISGHYLKLEDASREQFSLKSNAMEPRVMHVTLLFHTTALQILVCKLPDCNR